MKESENFDSGLGTIGNELFNPQPEPEEIGNGMTVEEMTALYFDHAALVEAPQKVFRLNTSGNRYYYTFEDEYSEPTFFVSVTTFIKQTLPTSEFLIKWIADMGYDESRRYMMERASYGTFMHTQIADFIINKTYDLDSLKGKLKAYIEAEKLPNDFIHHADELKKDMLAFAQFCIERNVKPLAIEIVLTHPTDGYAGAIDLACEFDGAIKGFHGEVYKSGKRAGEQKETTKNVRCTAIVDFKSGRKGFYESSEAQLAAYKEMWNKRFPDKHVEYIFNWSPKEWRGSTPTYNLVDQTNSNGARKLPYLVELARIENSEMNNTVISCGGVISMQTETLEQNISEFTLSELVKKKKTAKETPSESKQLTTEEIAGKKAAQVANKGSIPENNTDIPEKAKKAVKTPKKSPKDLGI